MSRRRRTRDRVSEVELLVVLEAFALIVVEDAVNDVASLLSAQHRIALDWDDLALVADRRWKPAVRWTSEARVSIMWWRTAEKSKSSG